MIISSREMLKSALRTLVRGTKIEILCWNMVKNDEFNFLKVLKIIFFNIVSDKYV